MIAAPVVASEGLVVCLAPGHAQLEAFSPSPDEKSVKDSMRDGCGECTDVPVSSILNAATASCFSGINHTLLHSIENSITTLTEFEKTSMQQSVSYSPMLNSLRSSVVSLT